MTSTTATTLTAIDEQNAQFTVANQVLDNFTNAQLAATPLWSTTERGVFLNRSHTTIDNNVVHIEDNVATRYKHPTFTRTVNTVRYDSGGNSLVFPSVEAANQFLLTTTNSADRGGIPVTHHVPRREINVSFGGTTVSIGEAVGGQTRARTANFTGFRVSPSNGAEIFIVNVASNGTITTINDPFGGSNIATGTVMTITDGDTYTLNAYSYHLPTTLTQKIYPADRCTWRQNYTGSNYEITDATFFDGVTANGVDLSDAQLGYIGKSGRFVEIAG